MKSRASTIALFAVALAAGLGAVLLRDPSALPVRARRIAEQVLPSSALSSAAAVPASEAPRGKLRITVRTGGKAVAGASVTLLHEESHQQMTFPTREDGTETVLALPEGEYHLEVRHPDHLPVTVHRRLEKGEAGDVTVQLQRGARLEGKVVDGTGRPLVGARVLFLEPRTGAPISHDLGAKTDASGSYWIDGIPEGLYDVQFTSDRHRSRVHSSLAVAGAGQVFQVSATLDDGRRMTGRVVNEAGEPVSGATVVASNEESVTNRSGDGGRFMLEGLGESPVYCFASAPGYGISFLRGVPAGSADVEFRLPRTSTVSGWIEAQPLPERFHVRLSWFDPDAATYFPLYARAFDGAGGREFDVPDVSPGRYRLEIHAEGYEAQDVPDVSVSSGHALSGLQVRLRKKP